MATESIPQGTIRAPEESLKIPAELLDRMLEQYRNGERGLPTYQELADLLKTAH